MMVQLQRRGATLSVSAALAAGAVSTVLAAPGPTSALAATPAKTPGAVTTAIVNGQRVPVGPGWGPLGRYLGRYRLSATGGTANGSASSRAAVAPAPAPAAGIFSIALAAAERVTAPASTSTNTVTGELSVFLRKGKSGEPYSPSGILSVRGAAGNQVLYLTDLGLHGSTRTADVIGGSFLGVQVGTFTARARGTTMTARIVAHGLGTVHARLVRFSAQPAP